MTSAWGDSWGDAWGDSWGAVVVVEPPAEVPAGGGGWFVLPRLAGVTGDAYAILPSLEGDAVGRVGRVGKGRCVLPRLKARGRGRVEGAQLPKFVSAGVGALGVSGSVEGSFLTVRGSSVGQAGLDGKADAVLRAFTVKASGNHDPDEAAIVAFLMAA